MSMHKKPLTPLEEEGLRKHGLAIGTPSQLSDVFRHGVAWALSQQAAQPVAWAESIEAAFRCGFSSPATYNDTLLNTADEAWEEEKSYLLAAQPQQASPNSSST